MPRTMRVHQGIARLAALLLLLASAADALAQQRPPYRERPDGLGYERSAPRGEREHRPGEFDYYLLALSWSPTYCADAGDRRRDPQCSPRGRPYAFVLHGLWPQYERGFPRNCAGADRAWVPGPVADRMLDIMPSRRLVFHEYRTHGTCSGLDPEAYFDLARRLYEKVTIPRRYVGLVDERTMVGPAELIAEFVAANPGLGPDMVAVQCGGPGNRLREVRICFTKAGAFRPCGRNEDQRRLCAADRMYVPPVRAGGGGPERRGQDRPQELLPGPREERRQ